MRTELDLATESLDPPFAVVDLAAFEANAAELLDRAAGKPVRVVSKSLRCRALLEHALDMPGIAGMMCYSLPEALWHAKLGTSRDIVVAYPSVDRAGLRALAADAHARSSVTIMVDSAEQLELVDGILGAGHPPVRVCLELDASWRPLPALRVGAYRSPVFRPRALAELAKTVLASDGFELVGLMAYEGQIAGVGDRSGGRLRDAVIGWMQRRSAAELARRRAAAVCSVRALTELEFVNGGGSGSVESTGAEDAVTEIAAGSALLGPTLFDGYSRFHPRAAAMFALPVVRRPSARVATLFAGGYPASGAAGVSRLPSVHLPRGLSLTAMEGAGEVQTPVTGKAARDLRLGDRVWLRHAKAGELAERFTEYHLLRDGRIEQSVPTYRGEGKAFG